MTVEERIQKQRDEKLISLGYCKWVYSDLDYTTDEYPVRDKVNNKPCKVVALPVTDEQFERIIAIGNTKGSAGYLPGICKWFGIAIYVIGFICGIIMGFVTGRYDFSYGTMFAYWAGSLASGLIFQWMGEVLRALRTK